ncbi:MAG: hypothetical protein B9S33_04435 [Pedosphaera sp. Tous-C6FEB]|nr:MAG: hypothetical protein B9S33_04435 [Pedosphaera sp. Tous-C6FEB]
MSTNKRALGVAVAVLLFASLVALQVWRTPKPQLPPVATLPDGSSLRLAKVSFGTTHSPPGPWWRPLAQRLPSDWQRRFGVVTNPGLSTPTSSLGVWLEQEKAGHHSRWEFALVDEHGIEVLVSAPSSHDATPPSGPVLIGRAFTAFPRRGKMVLLRIYDHTPTGGRSLQASFHFPNPAPGPHPEWRPQPPPARARHGNLEITFKQLQTGLGDGSEPRSPKPGESSWARVDFEVKENGVASDVWTPDGIELSDATGNQFRQQSWSSGVRGGVTHLRWAPHLWPSETAWKLRTEFARNERAVFSTNELIVVTGLALPAADSVTALNLSTNRLGHTVHVLGLSHGRGKFGTRNSRMSSSGISIEVDVSPELGTRKRLTVLNVRDDQGRKVDSSGAGSGGGSYSFNFTPMPDARSLDFSLAVQEVVLGEFVVKPTPFIPGK